MHLRPAKSALLASLALIASLAPSLRAADVLEQVPPEALGFVIINDLAKTDVKVAQLVERLNLPYMPPLVFLKAVTGIDKGLNENGQFLFAMLPGPSGDNSSPQFAVWLPVADYDVLLKSLQATSAEGISGISVADEDLLVAKRGDWALIMDPQQRERMTQLLAEAPNPPAEIKPWAEWIRAHDAAAVAMRAGTIAILDWALLPQPRTQNDADELQPSEDIFGQVEEEVQPFAAADDAPQPSASIFDPIRIAIQPSVDRSPELRAWLKQVSLVGCAVRLDDEGNAQTSFRAAVPTANANIPAIQPALPNSMRPGSTFVVTGGGQLPASMLNLLATTYARELLHELKQEEKLDIDKDTAAQFVHAMQTAAANIQSWTIAAPLEDGQGVYTNNFLVVRTASEKTLVGHVAEVMQHWNTMHREAKKGTRLLFDIEDTKIGQHAATQYSIDIALTEGMPELPEIRQMMERFFGPGGKLRVWVVSIDDQTVLLAAATADQVATAVELLDRKQPANWSDPPFTIANGLLPPESHARLFLSAHGYNARHRKESEIMTGEVFGAPPPKPFPPSPPLGASLTVHENELRLDAAVPVDLIRLTGVFLKK
jgi:hypothetical protein